MTVTTITESPDRPSLGIVLMIIGIASFAIMDAIIKWLTADYPVSQVVSLRSWFGLPFLFLIALHGDGLAGFKTRRPLAHVGRFFLVLVLSFGFFWALSQMKLIDAVAITFAAPILIAALSVPILKETVGLHRWAAIGVGFCGVLIMLRPGMGVFEWAGVVALGSVLAYSLIMITTRALKSTETTAALLFYPQLGMSLIGILFTPFYWVSPSLGDLGLFALAGIFGSVGVLCVTHAFRLAPAATISPFEYTALIWATMLGFLLWGELPDTYTLVGAGIVMSSGLYIVYRETVKIGRARPQLPGMSPDDIGQ